MTVTGLHRAIAGIERRCADVVTATNAALEAAGQRILTDALEAVPIEHGDLKASGQVVTSDDGTVAVGFGPPWYAQVAHQPGKEPVHYLNDAFQAEVSEWPARLTADIRQRLGQ